MVIIARKLVTADLSSELLGMINTDQVPSAHVLGDRPEPLGASYPLGAAGDLRRVARVDI